MNQYQMEASEKAHLHKRNSNNFYNINKKETSKIQETGEVICGFLKKQLMVVLIICGAFLGFIIGYAINEPVQRLSPEAKYNVIILVGFPGELLIRMLKMLILPLITCSLIVGLAGLDSKVSGRVGLRAIIYYLTTTVIAAILGMILVSIIRPGNHVFRENQDEEEQLVRPIDSFMDIVRNMFPSNIVKACVEQDKTKIIEKNSTTKWVRQRYNTTGKTQNELDDLVKDKKVFIETIGSSVSYFYNKYDVYKIGDGLETKGSANFLGVIVFAIAVGIVAGRMREKAAVFVQFLSVFNEIITKLIIVVMWYAPVGICSLIMAKFAEMDDMDATFASLGYFIVTVVAAIAIHGLILLPALFFVMTRKNPYRFLKGMTSAMATAFGTGSSAATLPVTFRCLEENLHINKRITRFILPVGTTINMDGTALYEAISAIFIAQAVGRSLSFGDYIAISFTSILASIGAAAIPHAGLVTMLIVLDTVGLPTDMVAVIFSVDWFLDRCRTMINVLGDAYGAGIVQHLSRADLANTEVTDKIEENDHQEFTFSSPTLFDEEPTTQNGEKILRSQSVQYNKSNNEHETFLMRERKLTYC